MGRRSGYLKDEVQHVRSLGLGKYVEWTRLERVALDVNNIFHGGRCIRTVYSIYLLKKAILRGLSTEEIVKGNLKEKVKMAKLASKAPTLNAVPDEHTQPLVVVKKEAPQSFECAMKEAASISEQALALAARAEKLSVKLAFLVEEHAAMKDKLRKTAKLREYAAEVAESL